MWRVRAVGYGDLTPICKALTVPVNQDPVVFGVYVCGGCNRCIDHTDAGYDSQKNQKELGFHLILQ